MNIKIPDKQYCLFCGQELKDPHGNRKFCDFQIDSEDGDRDCKITYNNLKAKGIRDKTKNFRLNSIKNMKILDELYNEGCRNVSGDVLESKGFNSFYSTVTMKDANTGASVPSYYTYALKNLGSNQFQIIKL